MSERMNEVVENAAIAFGDEANWSRIRDEGHGGGGGGDGGGGGYVPARVVETPDEMIQKELDIMMDILEENQDKMPEGAYLRGMNALGALHKHKRTTLSQRRPGDLLRCWMTLDEIEESDEDLYHEIMDTADDIVVELCGEEASIYMHDDDVSLVDRGEEQEVFQLLVNYKPEPGNAGYETSPMVLHHAIQVIMRRMFDDTYRELEVVRPVSCQCGWRGVQGNWDRHISNPRHQRWVVAERHRKFERALATARQHIVARREDGIVYIDEMHETPEVKIAREEVIAEAETAGQRVVFVGASGSLSWFT
jgi:hypothetical protein